MEECGQAAIEAGMLHPRGNRIGIMLMVIPILPRKASAPERWIRFHSG
jgi:hypothetical protein